MQTRNNTEKVSLFFIPKGLVIKGLCEMQQIIKQTKKIAEDDPRRLIHSLKVGISITLVSLFYYFQPLYVNLGVSAMWAVMTVIVVSEFSVGATLGKGVNRIFATLVAGALGLGAHHLSTVFGKTYEPIFIGFFVFLQAAASTFIRFFPKVKARYDYGMLIFILTFCMVSISGLRTGEVIDVAQKRLLMVLLGASTCVLVSILVRPVWAGEDLHKLVSLNLLDLGVFLEDECLRTLEGSGRSSLNGLNSVLDSKSSMETLANFAVWEPRHGRFMYRHPWKQYLKISCLTRQCAARVEALNRHLINTQIQFNIFEAPQEIKDVISSMSSEAGKALKDLGNAIETMTTRPTSVNLHLSNLKIRAKGFNSLINSDIWDDDQVINILQVMPIVAVASLLDETVLSVESIAVAVDELSSMAKFKYCNPQGIIEEKDHDTIEEKIDHGDDGSIKLNNNNNKHVSIEIIDGGEQVNKQEERK